MMTQETTEDLFLQAIGEIAASEQRLSRAFCAACIIERGLQEKVGSGLELKKVERNGETFILETNIPLRYSPYDQESKNMIISVWNKAVKLGTQRYLADEVAAKTFTGAITYETYDRAEQALATVLRHAEKKGLVSPKL